MYLMQKMTPAATADPAQAKMMAFMPLFMGFIFINLSSGLNLYIPYEQPRGNWAAILSREDAPIPAKEKFEGQEEMKAFDVKTRARAESMRA